MSGHVEAINVRETSEAAAVSVQRVRLVAGRGLEGDRYYAPVGAGSGEALTLIAAEALEAMAAEGGPAVAPADARRNVVTRSVDLDALVGRRFLLGEVECVGRRWCEPCAHLQRLTAPGALRGLVHRGGLRADILRSGTVRLGDGVRLAD